jgi:16S rRNA (adenine1518-N6/adenine1519-N6)-dimethyltransferase
VAAEHPEKLLRKLGLSARKSLGQNFLVPGWGAKIAAAARVEAGDHVVEIGPGLGALTDALLERGAHVTAVDLDEAMIRALKQMFGSHERLTLVHADAREVDFGEIAARANAKLRITGNLPYYTSSPLLRRTIEQREHVRSATFTLQKEVAERIASPPGSKAYGSLSVITQVSADATVPLKLPPGAFFPRPGVDSAVLHLEMRATPRVPIPDPALFERVVHGAFSQRRKTLLNSMRGSAELGVTPEVVVASLAASKIDPGRRAETLSVEEFGVLSEAVRKQLARSR